MKEKEKGERKKMKGREWKGKRNGNERRRGK